MEISDVDLVTAALDGDLSAYDRLVERHGQKLLAAALHLVGDPVMAEQLVREAFSWGYQALASCPKPDRFRTWVFAHLREQCRHQIEKRRIKGIDLSAVPDLMNKDKFSTEIREILIPYINALPPQYREILASLYLVEMTYEEIAAMLKISVAQVRERSWGAKTALMRVV